MTNGHHGGARFQTTHWTVVLEAAQPASGNGSEAFSNLYLRYWYPLYAYVRRRGFTPAEAEDLTQDFFVRLVEKAALSGLQKEGGRFRSFLLRSLENFLANEWDKSRRRKRGSGEHHLSLDTKEGEARLAREGSLAGTPEVQFEKQWAFTLLENVTKSLREEYQRAGKGVLFEKLRIYLQGDRGGPPYAAVALALGMTEGAVKVAVHRMRARYGELLRHEISRTAADSDEVDDELRHLISVVGN